MQSWSRRMPIPRTGTTASPGKSNNGAYTLDLPETPSKPFPVMDLPVEVRQQIWTAVVGRNRIHFHGGLGTRYSNRWTLRRTHNVCLHPDEPIWQHVLQLRLLAGDMTPRPGYDDCLLSPLSKLRTLNQAVPALLRVSRAVYLEVRAVLYGSTNVFVPVGWYDKPDKPLRLFHSAIGGHHAAFLARLEVVLVADDETNPLLQMAQDTPDGAQDSAARPDAVTASPSAPPQGGALGYNDRTPYDRLCSLLLHSGNFPGLVSVTIVLCTTNMRVPSAVLGWAMTRDFGQDLEGSRGLETPHSVAEQAAFKRGRQLYRYRMFKPVLEVLEVPQTLLEVPWPAEKSRLRSFVLAVPLQHAVCLGVGAVFASPQMEEKAEWEDRLVEEHGWDLLESEAQRNNNSSGNDMGAGYAKLPFRIQTRHRYATYRVEVRDKTMPDVW